MAAARSPLWRRVLLYWKAIITIATPLLLLPLPLVSATPEARCGYVVLLMAVYWMTEAMPLAITSLLPIVGFPLLGIMSTGELSLLYMKETIMMLLGGMGVAIAVEHSNLHQRIALFVLLHVGQSPRRLMAGFMLTTMFLSMWISNTASAAMMVPIVDSIMLELFAETEVTEARNEEETLVIEDEMKPDLHEHRRTKTASGSVSSDPSALREQPKNLKMGERKLSHTDSQFSDLNRGPPVCRDVSQLPEVGKDMRKAMLLSVAYSANIGGTGVVTGTGPNLVFMDLLNSCYEESTGLTYASWMGFNIPGMVLCVLLAWVWLQFYFLGCRAGAASESTETQREAVKRLVKEKYCALQSISFHESVVVTLFVCLVVMWVFRAPEFVKGWGYWFETAFGQIEVDDATPAMLIVILLFLIPKKLNFLCFRNPMDPDPEGPNEACLNWKVINEKMPWNVMLLLGGGFAISEAANVSGLSTWLGVQLESFSVMPAALIVFVVCLLTAMVTEVASNTAAASILLPVLNNLAIGIGVNPLYLMLPATVCCSYAFMLPVATPPNAIVFAASDMKTSEMMKVGIVMNVICVLAITLMINSLGLVMFDIATVPEWINSTQC